MSDVDPANVKPGEHAPVPATRDDLLIEALRTIDRMSGLFNEIAATCMCAEVPVDGDKLANDIHNLVLRRFSDCSGVHVFIAAQNLGIDLPPDLDGSEQFGAAEARQIITSMLIQLQQAKR